MGYSGRTAQIQFLADKMAIVANVRYRKAESVTLPNVPEKVVMRANGSLVQRRAVDKLTGNQVSFGYVDEQGNEVAKDAISYYSVDKEGKESQLAKMKLTKIIQIARTIPLDRLNEFAVDAVYEVWADEDAKLLWKLAEYLNSNNQVGVSVFSHGNGFKNYIALLRPVFIGESWVMTMTLAQKRAEFKNVMAIPTKAEIEKKPEVDELLVGI